MQSSSSTVKVTKIDFLQHLAKKKLFAFSRFIGSSNTNKSVHHDRPKHPLYLKLYKVDKKTMFLEYFSKVLRKSIHNFSY